MTPRERIGLWLIDLGTRIAGPVYSEPLPPDQELRIWEGMAAKAAMRAEVLKAMRDHVVRGTCL